MSMPSNPGAPSPASPATGEGPQPPARTGALLFLLVIFALGGAAWWAVKRSKGGPQTPSPQHDPDPGEAAGTSGFVDAIESSGIGFRMNFLPEEQGEHFKINLYDHGCGVAVADFDGDGLDDLYFCNQLGPNALYRSLGGGKFEDVTQRAGVAMADVISVSATWGDCDADGRPDLYVTTTRGGNVLFHNRGDGTFEDVTAKAGLTLVAHSESAVFFDADGDGDLDLYVTNTAKWTTDVYDATAKYYEGPAGLFPMINSPREPNRLYRNRGDGTFQEATEASGLQGVGWGGDITVFDFDEDGDLDVFVANMFGRSLLFRNDGKGHFQDVTKEVLGRTSWGTVGSKAFDYDGDGRLDLLLVDMHSDMWMDPREDLSPFPETRKYDGFYGPLVELGRTSPAQARAEAEKLGFRVNEVVFGNTLFHALGSGRFEETSDRAGLETLWPWGIAAGDFDMDGSEDVYLPSGMGFPYPYWRSPLMLNDGHGHFSDHARAAGLDPPLGGTTLPGRMHDIAPTKSSRSAATGDFDGDGRLDLVVNNFNDRPYLLLNRYPKRSTVELRLVGAGPNRDAIGAIVRLKVGARTLVRQVHAAGGYLSQSSNMLHFGLGDAKKIDGMEIRWPSGLVQTLDGPEINGVRTIREPKR